MDLEKQAREFVESVSASQVASGFDKLQRGEEVDADEREAMAYAGKLLGVVLGIESAEGISVEATGFRADYDDAIAELKLLGGGDYHIRVQRALASASSGDLSPDELGKTRDVFNYITRRKLSRLNRHSGQI